MYKANHKKQTYSASLEHFLHVLIYECLLYLQAQHNALLCCFVVNFLLAQFLLIIVLPQESSIFSEFIVL